MIFEVFEDVLAELEARGRREFGADWPAQVLQSLDALAGYYGGQNLRNAERQLVDYSGLPTQAAYIFMYAIGRAEFTYQLLKRFRNTIGAPLFPEGSINVTSIGGGPASELVGLIKYLEDPDSGENVDEILYDVIDKEGDWNELASLVIESLPDDILIIPQFFQADICDKQAANDRSLRFDDLVIMSFFISEICALPDPKQVRENLETLLRTMKDGSRLFYNDSDAYSFYSYMNARARSVKGLNEVAEIQDHIHFDYTDPGPTYQAYVHIFDRVPHLVSRAVSKFYKRDA